jgi:RNase P protein component
MVSLFILSQGKAVARNDIKREIPQSFRFMMVSYEPSNPYLEKYQIVN